MTALVLALLLLSAATASGQVETTSETLGQPATLPSCDDARRPASRAAPGAGIPSDPFAIEGCDVTRVMSLLFSRGSLDRLRRYIEEGVLDRLVKAGLGERIGDPSINYYRVVWVDDVSGSTPVVRTLLVHHNESRTIDTLPGLTSRMLEGKPLPPGAQLIDLFISTDPTALLDSQYIATRVKDPLLQIPASNGTTNGLGFLAGIPAVRGEAAVKSFTYTIKRPVLQLPRATIKITDTVMTVPTGASIVERSATQRDQLKIREARGSQCSQRLADSHAQAIAGVVTKEPCVVMPGQPLNETQANACKAILQSELRQSYSNTIRNCTDAAPAGGSDPVLVVDSRFTDLVATMKVSTLTAGTTLTNTPHTRYTLGLLTGAILGEPKYSGSTVRAKIGASGTILSDPMPIVLTMAGLNIHPWAYDGTSERLSWAERIRIFAGMSLTPDFGVGGGVGVGIIRGVSVNVGWVDLFFRAPASGLQIGDNPGTIRKPLEYGHARIGYAGLSFGFK